MIGQAKYRYFFDDFEALAGLTMVTQVADQGWITTQDTGVTLIGANDDDIGELEAAGMDADNDEFILARDLAFHKMEQERKLWFEARVKKADITDDTAMFVGMAWDAGGNRPVPAGFLIDDTGGIITGATGMSYIGFHVDIAAAATVDFVYGAEGQAAQIAQAGIATMVADTYIKLGFKYDKGKYGADGRVSIWIDGTLKADREITQANIEAATFPEDELLTPTFTMKINGTPDTGGAIDWIACMSELNA